MAIQEDGTRGRDSDLEALFRRHYPAVLAYLLRRVDDAATAEDLCAETFAVAWRRRDVVPADALPWLLASARRLLANHRRATRRQGALFLKVAQEGSTDQVIDPAEIAEERATLAAAFGRLNEREREVLLLVAWEGLDNRQAATVVGCSTATFSLRLHRARRRLMKEIESAGHLPSEGTDV